MGRRIQIVIGAACLALFGAGSAPAIHVEIDYTYDTSNFFALASPARATIEAVAGFYSGILTDTFSPVTVPEPFTSSLLPGQGPGTISWELNFTHPSTGAFFGIGEAAIAADEYRIYVGARSLPGATLGQGGFGVSSYDTNGGSFTQEEFDEFVQIRDAFENAVSTRGEATGFAAWGGSISFDSDAGTTWHFNHTTSPTAGTSDLFSVAIHEIGHALGLGASDEWNALTAGSGDSAIFSGPAAVAEYGGNVPLAFNFIGGSNVADKAHWREGTMSKVYGAAVSREAAMDPSVTTGMRKRLTDLDAAALADIGWSVVESAGLLGDYNNNHIVDAADYTVWRNGLGGAYIANDYTAWKTHFGETAGSGSGAAAIGILPTTVPEPTGLLLLSVASPLVFQRFFWPRRLLRRSLARAVRAS